MFCLNSRFTVTDGVFKIASVLRGGQLGAKVQPGDELRSVDKVKVAGKTEIEVEELLCGGQSGEEICLELYRPASAGMEGFSYQIEVTRVQSEMQDIQARVLRAVLAELSNPIAENTEASAKTLWQKAVLGINQLKLELEQALEANKDASLIHELRNSVRSQQHEIETMKAAEAALKVKLEEQREETKKRLAEENRNLEETKRNLEEARSQLANAELLEQQRLEGKVTTIAALKTELAEEKEHRKMDALKIASLSSEVSRLYDSLADTEDDLHLQLKTKTDRLKAATEKAKALEKRVEAMQEEMDKAEAERLKLETTLGAGVSVTVAMPEASGWSKKQKRAAQKEFAEQLCECVEVTTERIQVVGSASKGGPTVQIDMLVLPQTSSVREPTALELVREALRQCGSKDSRLRRRAALKIMSASENNICEFLQNVRAQALTLDALVTEVESSQDLVARARRMSQEVVGKGGRNSPISMIANLGKGLLDPSSADGSRAASPSSSPNNPASPAMNPKSRWGAVRPGRTSIIENFSKSFQSMVGSEADEEEAAASSSSRPPPPAAKQKQEDPKRRARAGMLSSYSKSFHQLTGVHAE